jgi:hypothetical protein
MRKFSRDEIYACDASSREKHLRVDVPEIKCTVKFTHEEQSAEGVPNRNSTYTVYGTG